MIGNRIRYHRKKNGLTLEQLSEGICSVSYLSKIEHGDKSSEEVSKLLCQRLKIDFDETHTELINKVDDQLSDWYEQMITTSDIQGLAPFKKELEVIMPVTQEPLLTLKFDLMTFCYFTMLEDFEKAAKIKKQLDRFKEMFTPELRYYYALFSGTYYCSITRLDQSYEMLYQAVALQAQIPHTEQDVAELSYQIARIECLKYHVPKCLHYASQALSIFNSFYNLKRIADCQTLLGISHRRINNFPEAEHHYEQALKFVAILKNEQRIAILYHNLGFCYASTNQHQKAIDYLLKSLRLKEEIKASINSISSTLTLLASEYYRVNDHHKAKETVEHSLLLIKHDESSIHYLKLKVLDFQLSVPTQPEYEVFLRQKVIPTFSDNNMWEDVSVFAEQLAEHYFTNHQYKLASLYYKKAHEARKHIL